MKIRQNILSVDDHWIQICYSVWLPGTQTHAGKIMCKCGYNNENDIYLIETSNTLYLKREKNRDSVGRNPCIDFFN